MQETMESLNVAMEEVCLEVKELDSENKEEAINERYVVLSSIRLSLVPSIITLQLLQASNNVGNYGNWLSPHRYVKRAETLSAEIHAQHGLTREVLQAAMMKYQQEPSFLMAMTELQQQQAERFAAAASIFNGEVNMGLE